MDYGAQNGNSISKREVLAEIGNGNDPLEEIRLSNLGETLDYFSDLLLADLDNLSQASLEKIKLITELGQQIEMQALRQHYSQDEILDKLAYCVELQVGKQPGTVSRDAPLLDIGVNIDNPASMYALNNLLKPKLGNISEGQWITANSLKDLSQILFSEWSSQAK